jgi:hypothetical protein
VINIGDTRHDGALDKRSLDLDWAPRDQSLCKLHLDEATPIHRKFSAPQLRRCYCVPPGCGSGDIPLRHAPILTGKYMPAKESKISEMN